MPLIFLSRPTYLDDERDDTDGRDEEKAKREVGNLSR